MQIKIGRWIASGAMVGMLMLGVAGGASGSTNFCAGTNPINDNYLCSLNFNEPGKPLNSTDTLEDTENMATATTQNNIFSPCGLTNCPSGGAEVTSCDNTTYGNTIWYDFYPNAKGLVSIRTQALFDNVITVYQYNQQSLAPELGTAKCAVSSFGSGQLVASVKKGADYTVQVGAISNPGPIHVLFDFFKTPPKRLSATTFLKASTLSNGLDLSSLTVSTARGAKVSVSCGGLCRSVSKSVPRFGSNMLQFPSVSGVRMPSGSKLLIHVTAPHSIGALVQYTILPGNFSKQTFCTEPGSSKPRSKCQ
ncbi:MAG: hypothetical protein ACLP4R_29815 [Solirubrobacteraceae bacterium]